METEMITIEKDLLRSLIKSLSAMDLQIKQMQEIIRKSRIKSLEVKQ
jgi:hypothetical protein